MTIAPLAAWCPTDALSAPQFARLAQSIEDWGYGALWLPEMVGRNVLLGASWALANTQSLTVATGIASIYARDAQAMVSARNGLAEQSDGRFLLGIGVSHAPMVEAMRGHHYGKPVASMRAYIEAMDKAPYMSVPPASRARTVLAALGPRMIELSAALADGAHTYNVTPEHTAQARTILGAEKLLCIEQKLVLDTDPARARTTARLTLTPYLALRNYQESWRRQGFEEADWSGVGSDRLVDAMVAWGDEETLLARVRAHLDAGADQVCIQPLSPEGFGRISEELLARLAPSVTRVAREKA